MARKTIFDIYDEVQANEKPKEQLPTNEVVQEQIEEINTVIEETKTEHNEQPQVDTQVIEDNNTLQSIITNQERGD